MPTMKSFLLKIALFLGILAVILAVGLALPATPRARTSLLFSMPKKDSLLRYVKSPRIVLVGGSNVSMSLDSQTIKDSIGRNPINTGVHAAIGLVYMLDHTFPGIKKGDVVVVIPEYDQLFGDFAYGANELFRTVFDVRQTNLNTLRWKQIKNTYEFLPAYAVSKYMPSEYKTLGGDAVYLRDAFNSYGDCYKRLENREPNELVFGHIDRPFNPEIITILKDFETKVKAKGASMIVAFPAFEQRSYDNSADKIREVEKAYRDNHFTVVGNPQKYRFPNELMYDTPYHLSTKGVQIRTQMLIAELLHEAKIQQYE